MKAEQEPHLLGTRPLSIGAKGGDERGAGHNVRLDAPAAPHLVKQPGATSPVATRRARADDSRKGVACWTAQDSVTLCAQLQLQVPVQYNAAPNDEKISARAYQCVNKNPWSVSGHCPHQLGGSQHGPCRPRCRGRAASGRPRPPRASPRCTRAPTAPCGRPAWQPIVCITRGVLDTQDTG